MGIYYNPPQPAQLAPHVVQASTGQNPPIKALAATVTAILTLWPVGYDHSAYAQNCRPKQTAPLTLVYGARPPVTSPASFYAQRAQWSDATWSSPQRPPEAAITPRVDNPPLQSAAPVFIKDPARPIYGLTWQYGTQNAKGDFSGWSAPPSAQAPPIIGAGASNALASWANPSWPAQDLGGPVIQPHSGDEPPGVSSSVTDLSAFGYYDGWPSQRLSFAATAIPPPIVSAHIGPSPFPYAVILSWQVAPTWSAQTQPDVQPLAAIIYGAQPPPLEIANLLATLQASWPQSKWPPQSAPRYTPSGSVAAPVLTGINTLVPVLSWHIANWSTQRASGVASLPRADAPPPKNGARSAAYAIWPPVEWTSGPLLVSAATLPVPRVDSPQPGSFAIQFTLRATWPIDSWPAQTVRLVNPHQPFKRGELIPLWPDDRRITITVDDRRIYPVPLT